MAHIVVGLDGKCRVFVYVRLNFRSSKLQIVVHKSETWAGATLKNFPTE